MTKYRCFGEVMHTFESGSDNLARRIATYLTANPGVGLQRFNGKYWEASPPTKSEAGGTP